MESFFSEIGVLVIWGSGDRTCYVYASGWAVYLSCGGVVGGRGFIPGGVGFLRYRASSHIAQWGWMLLFAIFFRCTGLYLIID